METLRAQAPVAEGQSIIAAWKESGLVTQVFPLHETFALTQLQTSWVKNIFAPQPLGECDERLIVAQGDPLTPDPFQMILPNISA